MRGGGWNDLETYGYIAGEGRALARTAMVWKAIMVDRVQDCV